MSTTAKQDSEFISSVIGSDLLENAIHWIKNNLSPEDIFPDKELQEWAENNNYTHENDLEKWALDNGYIKE